MSDKQPIEEYLQQVCQQIRWKKAYPVIRRELLAHMEDQTEAYISGGMEQEDAEKEAVKMMGSPELVGSQLDQCYRPRPAWGIIAVAVVIMTIGFFARMYILEHIEIHYVQSFNITRSIVWQLAAVAALLVGYFVDYTVFAKRSTSLYLAFLGVMLIPPTSLGLAYYTCYLFYLMPVIYAAVLWRYPYKGYSGLLSAYLCAILMIAFGVAQSQSVAGIVYGAVSLLLLTISMLNGKFAIRKPVGLLILYGPVALLGGWLVTNTSIVNRIFHPELDPLGSGYVGTEIHRILAGARMFGTGSAVLEPYFLPDAIPHNMLTFFIHQFGWIALVIVLLLFGALLAFSCIKISKQKSRLGKMVAGAVTATYALQCVVYLFNNVFNMFISFTTLPLLSYGNAAMVSNAFLLGLMLSVFRNDDAVRDSDSAPKYVPRLRIHIEPLQ